MSMAMTKSRTGPKLFGWARNPDLKVIPAVERELVINAPEADGNQVQSAKLLGITRATRKRIEKFDIKQGLTVE